MTFALLIPERGSAAAFVDAAVGLVGHAAEPGGESSCPKADLDR